MKLVPEFISSNFYVTLKETEQQLLVDHLLRNEEEAKQIKLAEENMRQQT